LNSDALCEHELDLQMAEALPHRDTLAAPPITIIVQPNIQSGVALAISVLSRNTITAASVTNGFRL